MKTASIPIRNIYYLLCYAWNQLAEGALIDISSTPTTDLIDLLAVTLEKGVRHAQRKGLDRKYIDTKEEIVGARGRIDLLTTERRLLHIHGHSACEFDDLTANCPENQILRATLKRLAATETLHKSLKPSLLARYRSLRGVDDVTLSSMLFKRVQLHSNNRYYAFLLNICELVYNCLIPEEGDGGGKFRDFIREDRAMARVFESFLFNFARLECKAFEVSRDHVNWKATSSKDYALALLPRMITDISLRSSTEHVVIDAKYYSETLNNYYGVSKLKNHNLYQLLTYLQNTPPEEGRRLSGALIYPEVGHSLEHEYEICGFPIRIATINLALPWQEIRNDLLRLLRPSTSASKAA